MVTLTVMHHLLNFFCVLVISEKVVLAVLLAVMQLHPLTIQRLVLANKRREKNFQFLQKLKFSKNKLVLQWAAAASNSSSEGEIQTLKNKVNVTFQ